MTPLAPSGEAVSLVQTGRLLAFVQVLAVRAARDDAAALLETTAQVVGLFYLQWLRERGEPGERRAS